MGEALAAAGFRAVGPLLPGHGTTPEDLYITTGADLLRAAETALLSLRGARRIFLCGLSAGALLAVHLAARSWSHEGLPDFSAIALLAPAIEFRGSSWIFANVFGRLPALPFILSKGGRDIAAGEADEREKVDGTPRRHPPPLGGRAARALAGRREPRAARPRACAPPPRRARSHGRARLLAQALAHARVHAGGGPAVPAQRPRASAGRRVGRGLPRGGHVLPGSRLMARYVLAIDQGTTGTHRARRRRTKLDGQAKANVEFPQHLPQAGLGRARSRARSGPRVEAPSAARCGEAADRRPATSPRSGSPTSARRRVLWDRATGQAASTTRSSGRTGAPPTLCDRAQGATARSRWSASGPGLVLDPYFSGTKIALAARPRRRARARAPSAASSASAPSTPALVWQLTGGARARHRRRPTRRRTLLMDLARSPGTTSCSRSSACRARCCRRSRPSPSVVGDDQRAARCCPTASRSPASPATSRRRCSGRRASPPGEAKCTYGTGAFLLMNIGATPVAVAGTACSRRSAWQLGERDRPTRSRAARSSPAPRCSGCATGSELIKTRAETSRRSPRRCRTSGGVVFVPALAGLGAPHWDPTRAG